jgi:AraC-like DNA-binding protein
MDDRLVWLLTRFQLHARVFQAGPLCRSARFDSADGLGYIHLIRGGTLRVETAGHPALRLEEPSLVLYMNPLDHLLRPGPGGAEMLCASFEFGSGLGNPLARALPGPLALKLREVPALDTTLGLLFTEATEQHCGRQAVLDRLVEVVIVQLLRDLMDQKRLDFGLLAGLADPRLMKAINAMHADPARAWTLEDLATAAGMSRARFAARFRETVGTTPGAYLSDWRLSVAQSLLRRGKPVQTVADAVGYRSASALSRAFAARVGHSPRDWLRQRAGGA